MQSCFLHASQAAWAPAAPRAARCSARRSAFTAPAHPGAAPVARTRPCGGSAVPSMQCTASAGRWSVRMAASSSPTAEVADAVRGCRTVLAELQGLDFPRAEVRLYLAAARKVPKGFRGSVTDLDRARAAFELLLKVDEDGDPLPASRFPDAEGLALTQALLSELWRWRRRGGGMGDEDMRRPHEFALADIQDFQPEDIDRITSSLLDNLPNISNDDKKEMSQGMQQVAVGAFQGAVWGSLALSLLFVIVFNFIRGG